MKKFSLFLIIGLLVVGALTFGPAMFRSVAEARGYISNDAAIQQVFARKATKSSNGSTTAVVTFEATSGYTWCIDSVTYNTDKSSAYLKVLETTTEANTDLGPGLGTQETTLFNMATGAATTSTGEVFTWTSSGSGPVYIGTSSRRLVVRLEGTANADLSVTATRRYFE